MLNRFNNGNRTLKRDYSNRCWESWARSQTLRFLAMEGLGSVVFIILEEGCNLY